MKNYMKEYHTLMRNLLDEDELRNLTKPIDSIPIEGISYFYIKGVADSWGKESYLINKAISKTLASMSIEGVIISFIISFDYGKLNLYIGTYKELLNLLEGALKTAFSGLSLMPIDCDLSLYKRGDCIGIITGQPMLPDENQKRTFIDLLCEGMSNENFNISIIAKRLGSNRVKLCHEEIIEVMDSVGMELTLSQSAIGQLDGATIQKNNHSAQKYYESLKQIESQFSRGMAGGIYQVSITANTLTNEQLERLATVLKVTLHNSNYINEPIRFIRTTYSDYFGRRLIHVTDKSRRMFIGTNLDQSMSEAYSTLMDVDMLSAFINFPSQEIPGFYINGFSRFDQTMRKTPPLEKSLEIGKIVKNQYDDFYNMNPYMININQMSLHALIIGMTGNGKTTTVKELLKNISDKFSISFLVIESAKKEYYSILGSLNAGNTMVFTPGLEAEFISVPFRLNPFEFNPEETLAAHIDSLMATFKAAFDMPPPVPYVLEQAILEIYLEKGWNPIGKTNRFGVLVFPTLTDLYNKIDDVTNRMGYYPEITSNVKAALKARINSLRFGGRGLLFDTVESINMELLMNTPTVIELDALGDDQSKAFFMGLLLSKIYAYQRNRKRNDCNDLNHVLVIEEAHRLLKNVDGADESANVQRNAVNYFCNMLSEIRSYGQSLVIVDQIASKLAPDTYMNTNLKICHRIVALTERELMGATMNMTQDQIDYLASLEKGYAAVYSEGDFRPKLIKVPYYNDAKLIKREDILTKSRILTISSEWFKYPVEITERHRASARTLIKDLKSINALEIIKNKSTISKHEVLEIFQYSDRISEHELSIAHQICLIEEITKEEDFKHLKMSVNEQLSLILEVGYGI